MLYSESTAAAEFFIDRVNPEDALASCRDHLESLQNLRYLTFLEADQPIHVREHLRTMDWHLHKLAKVLLLPS